MTALPVQLRGGVATLTLLDELDVPWISALIDEIEAAVGRSWRDLLERIARLPQRAAPARRDAVIQTLRTILAGRQAGPIKASAIRLRLFGKAVLDPDARAERLSVVASEFLTSEQQIEVAMWADLPNQRIVVMPQGRPTALAVAAATNLAMIKHSLMRCHGVRLRLTGNARAIARSVALRGLLMTARTHDGSVELTVSGPLALFHRTTVYGRALGGIASHLAWSEKFILEAEYQSRGQIYLLRIMHPVLLPAGKEPNRYDSLLEARFARDFAKQAPQWRLLREPTPVDAEGRLTFPDFLIEHRECADRRWWIEIIGFWTAEYIQQKLATYRAARLPNVILCIDARRAVDQRELPVNARIVRFSKSIVIEDIMQIVN